MSFEKFVESVDEHFKAMRNPMQEMQKIYESETGKSVKDRELQSVVKASKKNNKEGKTYVKVEKKEHFLSGEVIETFKKEEA